ncbi:DNA polymerase thumb domain-containing protein [Actinomadura meridiana]|uniref:DinB/UmuC family translesion DNA polymerase n=1 Tax=Actinomadura meridiana TaxID=559626 RepID=UPI0031E7A1A0
MSVLVSEGAAILHADLDAFYASVEQRDDPGLRGRPVIVGGGVVLAASYEARACGVRTAMGGGQARRLWGVGGATADKLARYGVTTVGDVADMPEATLVSLLGPGAGRHLHALASGRDPRVVRTGARRRSVGAQRALGRRARTAADLDAMLVGLVDRLGGRLRKGRRVCRTVVLRLRFGDFARATRSRTLPQATADTALILATARGLLAAATPMVEDRGLTLIGVSLGDLRDDRAVQLALPFDAVQRRAAMGGGELDGAVDGVRDRFGRDAITRAVLLGRDQGHPAPEPPDG